MEEVLRLLLQKYWLTHHLGSTPTSASMTFWNAFPTGCEGTGSATRELASSRSSSIETTMTAPNSRSSSNRCQKTLAWSDAVAGWRELFHRRQSPRH